MARPIAGATVAPPRGGFPPATFIKAHRNTRAPLPIAEPDWWYRTPLDRRARFLAPLARLYGAAAEHRFARHTAYRSRLPVICIGNFTAGGTGKTPLALLVAEYIASRGEAPVFLTRGHGGRTAGPKWVDPEADSATGVGDEALLLARSAPTLVSRDRKAGALAIEQDAVPASVIVMDDGLQNPALEKDLTIAVVDGARGVGNGMVIPAGPLRARVPFQLRLADAVVVNGPPGRTAGAASRPEFLAGYARPVLSAEAAPSGDTSWLGGATVAAYAGIGHPERFFAMLRGLGAAVAAARAFPDHHVFSGKDAREIRTLAARHDALLVTTEKDLARLSGARGDAARLRERSRALPIRLVFADGDGDQMAALVDRAVESGGYRTRRAQR